MQYNEKMLTGSRRSVFKNFSVRSPYRLLKNRLCESLSSQMASITLVQLPVVVAQTSPVTKSSTIRSFDGLHCPVSKVGGVIAGRRSTLSLKQVVAERVGRGKSGVVCAVGDVSSEGNNFLIAGAVLIALVGTALPFIFSRKDTCPECGGAGFVRGQASGGALRANAARKDQAQIVCKTCNGLGKIGHTDKV